MGTCIYCGQPAGLLKKQHRECSVRYQEGWSKMVTTARTALAEESDLAQIEPQLLTVAKEHCVPVVHLREALLQAFDSAVSGFLEDGLLTESEEERLIRFQRHFELSQEELDRSGVFMKLAKAAVLRDLMSGVVRERFNVSGGLPFNLQKGEKLIWLFTNVAYLTQHTRIHYEGRSSGVSVRIAKGVYYRTGAFQGYPVQTTYTSHEATGALGVTTKHLYFAGAAKALRLPYAKIVSLLPFSDGIGVHKDAVSAKPLYFITGDGWFTYNLLSNVSQL